MMEELIYVDRRNSNCNKWDGQTAMFGEEGLHAMWVADMDFKIPQCVQKALHDYVDFGTVGYYRIPDGYYDAFINWEKAHFNFEVKREWLRFAPGVVAAFNWMLQILTEPDDAVIVMTPVYYPFLQAVTNNERKLITSELVNEDGEYTIDFEDFEKKIIDNDVKAFILCSPHNPVARVWTKEELTRMFEICYRHHVYVISDEIHQDFVFGDKMQTPSYQVTEHWDEMVAITAPSKTFNLAGGQNSFVIIADEKLRARWDDFAKRIRLMTGNAFGFVAAEAAYKGGQDWLDKVKKQIVDNDQYLRELFKENLPEIVVTPLEGTYLVWIDLRAYVKPEETREFIQKKCRLAVDFGDWFGGEQFNGFIRMNLATSRENVEIGAKRIMDGILKERKAFIHE